MAVIAKTLRGAGGKRKRAWGFFLLAAGLLCFSRFREVVGRAGECENRQVFVEMEEDDGRHLMERQSRLQ